MKTNLRDRILELLGKAKERREMLISNMNSYVEMGNYQGADVCQTKIGEFNMFIENLETILK